MPEIRRYAGIADELVYGVKDDTNQTSHVNIGSSSFDVPNDREIEEPTGFGRGVENKRPGYYTTSGNFVYSVNSNTLEILMKALLGGVHDYSVPGTSKLVHVYGSDNYVLPSKTITIGKDGFEHEFVGCVINQHQIQVSNTYVQGTVDFLGSKDSLRPIKSVGQLLLPLVKPFVFNDVVVNINGVRYATVKSLTLNINNNFKPESGQFLGSLFSQGFEAGGRQTEITMELRDYNNDMLKHYWGGATGISTNESETIGIEIVFTGLDGTIVTVKVLRGAFKSVQTQPSGQDPIMQKVSLKAMYSDFAFAGGADFAKTDIVVTFSKP